MTSKMEFSVTARRTDASGSAATCKEATVLLDTALAGRRDAFNPAELLLAAVSACMIKGIERVAPMLKFSFRSLEVRVHGVRQDVPPRLERIDYEISIETDESDRQIELLHENVKKYGTVFNTVAPGTELQGVLKRAVKTVIFACVHNAGRSQMAAAFFNALADPAKARALSAGTAPGERVHPEVVAVMQEAGIDLTGARPRKLTADLTAGAQLLITMGCGDECPFVPGLRRDDWPLPDPKGQPVERVRAIRDDIRARVAGLIAQEGVE